MHPKTWITKLRNFHLEHWHRIAFFLVLFDIVAVSASFFGALWIRFDCNFSMIPDIYLDRFLDFLPIYLVICLVVFAQCRLYNSIWRFASFTELIKSTFATGLTLLLHIVGMPALFGRMPLSYFIFGTSFQFALTLGIRFSYRLVLLEIKRLKRSDSNGYSNIMLIGAGEAGQLILKDIKSKANGLDQVRCIIDDNSNKWGRYIDNIPVVGGRDDILACVKKYQIHKIFMAIPSASMTDKRDILNICKESGCVLKNLPGMDEIYNGHVTVNNLREVSAEDLLGRDPIKVDMGQIFKYLTDKVVLITGGAGSIGSELARQIAVHRPKQLLIFDIYENSAYELQLELQEKCPRLNFVTIIGSVRDSRKLDQVFSTYHPDVTFHAAAHKHVPLMESSPCEAIKNNTIGTYKTAYAAMVHGCKQFVLISSDKAVNPTNIMGASKRLCEMVIQSFDSLIKAGMVQKIPKLFTHGGERPVGELPEKVITKFVAVRFGNVLGSNGSVVPIFKKQIEKGGPVTVTHPDIIRYFMTISEAVSLVLQASAYAAGGEIFVLDMGSAVKIDTLARNLIRLSGYKPDVDIKIEYTGLRPGEKLYEEKLMEEEGMRKTPNNLIHIGSPIPFDTDVFLRDLERLMDTAYENDPGIREVVMELVDTYRPAGANGSTEKGEAYHKQVEQGYVPVN